MTVIILVGFSLVMGCFLLGLDSVLYFFWYLDMRTWYINIIIGYLGHEVMILNITYLVCKLCWKNTNSYLLCLLLYLQICVSLFERAFSRRHTEGCKMQTNGLQLLAEWCSTSPTSGGIDSPQRGRWWNKLIPYISHFQCNVFVTVFHSVQVFKLLDKITKHIKDVQKISTNKEEIKGLKKAVNDTENYLESNRSLVTHWFSTVSVWCHICKQTVQAEYYIPSMTIH